MFLPAFHVEKSIPVLREFIHNNPLGVLTTAIASETEPFILSTHIPWVLDVEDASSTTELGRLRGHFAKQNPQAKSMMQSLQDANSETNVLESEVLVLFTSNAHDYVTPKFYVETKPQTGKAVPTWNYAAVQAYGKAKIFFDSSSSETSDFLQKQVTDLTKIGERNIRGYTGQGNNPEPWEVSDAPEKYIEMLKKNIVGVQITIERLQGKFKMSQEMRLGDRIGVAEGFKALGTDIAKEISAHVQERSDVKEQAKAAAQ